MTWAYNERDFPFSVYVIYQLYFLSNGSIIWNAIYRTHNLPISNAYSIAKSSYSYCVEFTLFYFYSERVYSVNGRWEILNIWDLTWLKYKVNIGLLVLFINIHSKAEEIYWMISNKVVCVLSIRERLICTNIFLIYREFLITRHLPIYYLVLFFPKLNLHHRCYVLHIPYHYLSFHIVSIYLIINLIPLKEFFLTHFLIPLYTFTLKICQYKSLFCLFQSILYISLKTHDTRISSRYKAIKERFRVIMRIMIKSCEAIAHLLSIHP